MGIEIISGTMNGMYGTGTFLSKERLDNTIKSMQNNKVVFYFPLWKGALKFDDAVSIARLEECERFPDIRFSYLGFSGIFSDGYLIFDLSDNMENEVKQIWEFAKEMMKSPRFVGIGLAHVSGKLVSHVVPGQLLELLAPYIVAINNHVQFHGKILKGGNRGDETP